MPVAGGRNIPYPRRRRKERLGAEVVLNVSKSVSSPLDILRDLDRSKPYSARLISQVMTDLLCAHRTSSQKPGDELYENFRQHFPTVGAAGPSTSTTSGDSNPGLTTLGDQAVDVASQERLVVLDSTIFDGGSAV
jgi:hypothetical protein